MKLGDIVCCLNIDHRKLTEYALSLESPRGRHKAIVFEQALGFTQDNYTDLLEQIKKNILKEEATLHGEDGFGRRYTVDINMCGKEGQQAIARTGWLVPHGAKEARLITLYVRR